MLLGDKSKKSNVGGYWKQLTEERITGQSFYRLTTECVWSVPIGQLRFSSFAGHVKGALPQQRSLDLTETFPSATFSFAQTIANTYTHDNSKTSTHHLTIQPINTNMASKQSTSFTVRETELLTIAFQCLKQKPDVRQRPHHFEYDPSH